MGKVLAFMTRHRRGIVIVIAVLLAITCTVVIWLRGNHEQSQTNIQNSAPNSLTSPTQQTQGLPPANSNTGATPGRGSTPGRSGED